MNWMMFQMYSITGTNKIKKIKKAPKVLFLFLVLKQNYLTYIINNIQKKRTS